MNPSLSLINLLEQLTEFRETFYSLGHQFIIEGCNSGTATWKRCTGQSKEKGQGFSMPSSRLPLSLNLHGFANPEVL